MSRSSLRYVSRCCKWLDRTYPLQYMNFVMAAIPIASPYHNGGVSYFGTWAPVPGTPPKSWTALSTP